MASLSLLTAPETTAVEAGRAGATDAAEAVLVVGLGDGVASDYSIHSVAKAATARDGGGAVRFIDDSRGSPQSSPTMQGQIASLVLFLPPTFSPEVAAVAQRWIGTAQRLAARRVIVVTEYRFGSGISDVLQMLGDVQGGTDDATTMPIVLFETGCVLSPESRTTASLRRLGFLYPLVSRRLRGCCLEGSELFAAIDREIRRPWADGETQSPASGSRRRVRCLVMLGENRAWRERLAEHPPATFFHLLLQIVCAALALTGVGLLAAFVLERMARKNALLRSWNVGTLRPASFGELLALYNPYNVPYVKVVGYNNGVNHFGHRYPGRTIVSTVKLNRIRRYAPDLVGADCGTTIRRARDFLSADRQERVTDSVPQIDSPSPGTPGEGGGEGFRPGLRGNCPHPNPLPEYWERGEEVRRRNCHAPDRQDLYVIPNYSYVTLGTAFFVPIHGSAADYSCVADTFTRAVFYDPHADRIIAARREAPEFREHVYNLSSDVLLLRLRMRVKPASRYYVREQTLEDPDGPLLLDALRDERAANVEVRKANASGSAATLYQYYNDAGDASSPVLEVPRDSLGRLWDRLEENRVTAWLMHTLTRRLAWHVELFFTPDEFLQFWKDHRSLPVRKIQLRYIRRDGLPHSEFRDSDCVSCDMFTVRKNRGAVEGYLKRTFAVIRANPGKQSM